MSEMCNPYSGLQGSSLASCALEAAATSANVEAQKDTWQGPYSEPKQPVASSKSDW